MGKRFNRSVSKPVVSVCIANYNGIGLIDQCLKSVLGQDFDLDIEIIVHDDASTDRSADLIKKHYPVVKLIQSDKNVGFCVSNNRMVNLARGKFVLLLNNDAELFPDAIQSFYEYAQTQSDPTILGVRQFDATTGELVDFGIMFDPFLNSVPNIDLNRQDVGMVMGACIWIPKKLWEEIGGFPDWFNTMHEDMYICCLARLYGYPIRVLQNSGYKHWIGKSLGGGKIFRDRISTTMHRRYLSERNRIYVIAMCYPRYWINFILPIHLFFLVLEGVALSFYRKNGNLLEEIYIKSFLDAWKNRNKLIRLRRQIEKKRKINSKSFLSVVRPMPYKLRTLLKYGFPSVT